MQAQAAEFAGYAGKILLLFFAVTQPNIAVCQNRSL